MLCIWYRWQSLKSRNLRKIYYTLRLRQRPYNFFTPPIERRKSRGFLPPRTLLDQLRLLKLPAKSTFKHLILKTTLCQHLLLSMSSSPTSVELSDADCKKGQVSQWPPISYTQSKSSTALISSRDTIKMKTHEGESKQTLLCDRADGEEYAKYLMSFGQYSGPPRPPWLRISPSRRLQKHSLGKKKLQKP